MLPILLALAGSVAYGAADFFGGLSSRRSSALRVVAISAPASLLPVLVMAPFVGGRWSVEAVLWGAASGIAAVLVFALLYAALARGPMSVLSPITAVVSAVIPVVIAFGLGERLSPLGVLGVVVAVAAIPLVAGGPAEHRPSIRALLLGLGAGVAVALQLVFLDASPEDSGIVPLLVGRGVAAVVVLIAVGVRRASLHGTQAPSLALAVSAGVLDSLANLLFLLSARAGLLTVAAVIVALYPAMTIALARGVLKERLRPLQIAGLVLAGAAVALLALTDA